VFDALGNPLTGDVLVNATRRPCASPAVAGIVGGGFTVAWTEHSGDASNRLNVVARTFNWNGDATSDVFGVNTFLFGDQYAPSIANLGSQQLIVWTSLGQDGSWEGVFGRAFSGATALGDEFRVNVATQFGQKQSRVTGDGAGHALIFWSGYTADSGFDVFGRAYTAP